MQFFPDPETILTVGGFSLGWYTLTLLISIACGYYFLHKHMRANGYGLNTIDDIFVLALIGGIIGGRIGWILENWKTYTLYAWYMFAIADGGFEVITVLLGAGIAVFWYTKRKRMSFFRTMDLIAMDILQMSIIAKIGRCFGSPVTWIVVAMNTIGFIFIYKFVRPYHEGRRRGDSTTFALLWMGASKLIAFVFKLDPMAVNCFWTCIMAEAGGIILYVRNRSYKSPKPVILFDLDGTLMDSEGMVLQCFRWMYRKYGNIEEFTKEKQREVFGPPLKEELAKLFPQEDPNKLIREYRAFQSTLPGRGAVQLQPYAGSVLQTLHKHGYKLGIVSSRLTESCETWLTDLRIRPFIDVVVGRDQFAHAKPAPDGILKACEKLGLGHDHCIYIGDGVSDVKAGRAAGVFTVAVTSNPDRLEALRDAHPNAQITNVAELLPILKKEYAWTYEKI
jgi:phosphatidylglycerol:prolipoprotein diacylglycerol transferase